MNVTGLPNGSVTASTTLNPLLYHSGTMGFGCGALGSTSFGPIASVNTLVFRVNGRSEMGEPSALAATSRIVYAPSGRNALILASLPDLTRVRYTMSPLRLNSATSTVAPFGADFRF